MAPPKKYEIQRWETICSDTSDLYFHQLIDDGQQLIYSVKDKNFIYDFVFEKFGPYQIADEALLTKYWNRKNKSIGWTFYLKNSDWLDNYDAGNIDVMFRNSLTHYVISTWDSCLEILTDNPPTQKNSENLSATR